MRTTASLSVTIALTLAACSDQVPTNPGDFPAPPLAAATGPGSAPQAYLAVTVSDGTAISSDGLGEYVNGQVGVSAYIDNVGNLHFLTGGAGRSLVFNYGGYLSGDGLTPPLPTGNITTLTQASVSLVDLAVNATICSKMTIGYPAPPSSVLLSFRSNGEGATGPSTYVDLTRTSATTWTIVSNGPCAGATAVAGIFYTLDTTVKPSKNQTTLHAYYTMPFTLNLRKL